MLWDPDFRRRMGYRTPTWWGFLLAGLCTWQAPAAAIPVFARIYDKPCSACHTVFPQLNPEGENFRAHGLHGLRPAARPIHIAPGLDVPNTIPLALYVAAGEDVSKVEASGEHAPTRTHLNLDAFKLLSGGEVGRHLAFLLDYQFVETEPDSGHVQINTLPYQAYVVAHAERGPWLGNLKGGWYEFPLGISPEIHRLSARPYLIYGTNACTLLGTQPPHGTCDDVPTLGESQIGLETSVWQAERGLRLAAGATNGSNRSLNNAASPDFYARASQAVGLSRVGVYLYYSPDIVGAGVQDRALRVGPDFDLYTRQLRLFGQFLAGYESNPTGRLTAWWYYGGFLEAEYRFTATLLALLRVDYARTPKFDDTMAGGQTEVRRRQWELTGGWQGLIWPNVKALAELTYGEDHESVHDTMARTWAGTVRLVTAFWLLEPPGVGR